MARLGTRCAGLALVGAVLLLAGCPDDDTNPDLGPVLDGPNLDSPVCKRPPLSLCERPPYGNICPTLWYCPGCTCTGPGKVAACNPLNGDCRYFCTGCYPEEYTLCDQTAPPSVLGLCGYCFSDGGHDCDKLSKIDSYTQPPSDGGTNPDAGPTDGTPAQ